MFVSTVHRPFRYTGCHESRISPLSGRSSNAISKRFSASGIQLSTWDFKPFEFPFSLGKISRALLIPPEKIIKVESSFKTNLIYKVFLLHVCCTENLYSQKEYIEGLSFEVEDKNQCVLFNIHEESNIIEITVRGDQAWKRLASHVEASNWQRNPNMCRSPNAEPSIAEVGRALGIDPLKIVRIVGSCRETEVTVHMLSLTKTVSSVSEMAEFAGFEIEFNNYRENGFKIISKKEMDIFRYVKAKNSELES